MDPHDLEPELEVFMQRMLPARAASRRGATSHEIDAIEGLAGQPLPRCYRWFLATMGLCTGAVANYLWDFSAPTILLKHAEGEYRPNPRRHVIGHSPDGMMPLALCYDLTQQSAGDALVLIGRVEREHVYFDSLRELIAYGIVITHAIDTRAHGWTGTFDGPVDQVLVHLEPAMVELGFVAPLPTGQRCRIYQREDALLATECHPGLMSTARWKVHVYAKTAEGGQQVLDELTRRTPLAVVPAR